MRSGNALKKEENPSLGKAGEEAAVAHLLNNGYTILEQNWRMNHLELDIVAMKDDTLVVVEVKTRDNTDHNEPEDAVDRKKVRHIVIATDAYVKQQNWEMDIRFDIITAVGKPGEFVINHIEDAFYPPMFGR